MHCVPFHLSVDTKPPHCPVLLQRIGSFSFKGSVCEKECHIAEYIRGSYPVGGRQQGGAEQVACSSEQSHQHCTHVETSIAHDCMYTDSIK